ncbi:MAG: lipoyl synthase [Desulfobacterales bacterium]|nr:lipoyl synthase [Desulfobacterales bacterium]
MTPNPTSKVILKKPPWLKRRLPGGSEQEAVRALLSKGRLHTVCQEAKCPNLWECFSQNTATFLIMGSRCTRNCRFCAVSHGPVSTPDSEEPIRVAEAVQQMQLSYVVITSVTRDDLSDGGAAYFSTTIHEIRKKIPDILVEVLIPDFQGNETSIQSIVDAQPDILNHNLETVPRLYDSVRPQAEYRRSLELLKQVHLYDPALPTKSGLMLGLGEKSEEIQKTLKDLLDVGCRILTLGQYLQPAAQHLPVSRFIPPEEFDIWRKRALEIGFSIVASGPFIRSSYHAKTLFQAL